MQRADGNLVEQAETHRPVRLGMVAGRAAADEHGFGLTIQHGVHTLDHRAARMQRRVQRAGVHPGVGIKGDIPLRRAGGKDVVDMGRVMHPRQRLARGRSGLAGREGRKRAGNSFQTRHPLGMAVGGNMIKTGGGGDGYRAHGRKLAVTSRL